ncbi:MAG: hypothetical protein Q9O62_10350 [Ardenticatenia bacterium]|nr:hypothetical protein [Ardenticatenia bacterium]
MNNEVVRGAIFVVYSILFWLAMASGVLMTAVTFLAVWNSCKRWLLRHEDEDRAE